MGLVPLYAYTEFGHWWLGLQTKLPFVPLMLTSLYCSIGVIWSWVILYLDFLCEENAEGKLVMNNKKANSNIQKKANTKKKQ